MSVKTTASWSLECNVECPHCRHWFDLMDTADFLDGIQACEWGTPRSTDLEFDCPKCGKEFVVDLEY